jgi:NADP-dependent 3-hydroxy acid dehydrogenase YdfG
MPTLQPDDASVVGARLKGSLALATGAGTGIRATTTYPGETPTPLLRRRPVPVPPERHALILPPEDAGSTVPFVVTRPLRVLIEEIVVRPTAR